MKYNRNFAAAVIARSAPPGIELYLVNIHPVSMWESRGEVGAYGFIAVPTIAWKTSAVCPVLTLTATGT